MRVTAIIAAGGQGTRVGGDRPKQFLEVAGKSLLERSVEAFARSPRVDEIIVALPAEATANPPAFLRSSAKRVTVVAGGAQRHTSVSNAFARVSDTTDLVVIHDAARPFVTQELIHRTIDAAAAHGAAIAALPVSDTVKQAGAGRVIDRTLPRDSIFLAQTPQAFRRDLLAHALRQSNGDPATDEAMLAERAGLRVHIVEGDVRNIKVTTSEDLADARLRLEGPVKDVGRGSAVVGQLRIGTGYDLHRLVPGRPLILAGVHIPFDFGLEGHSDADIVCHAVTDAVLGAAAAGDIGRLFPDTDPRWKDADSVKLLRGAMEAVHAAGYRVSNVDVTVIAERPKLLPYIAAMQINVADALGIDAIDVSIKGKTNESVGAIGRGEAMACHAVALLSKT